MLKLDFEFFKIKTEPLFNPIENLMKFLDFFMKFCNWLVTSQGKQPSHQRENGLPTGPKSPPIASNSPQFTLH